MTVDFKRRHNVTTIGNGEKTLLFIHGFASSQEAWKWVTPAFLDTHRLILVDPVGSGKSAMEGYDAVRYQSLEGHVDDLIAFCKAYDLDDLVILGHSVGGTIGLMLAKALPERMKQVIMVGASPR